MHGRSGAKRRRCAVPGPFRLPFAPRRASEGFRAGRSGAAPGSREGKSRFSRTEGPYGEEESGFLLAWGRQDEGRSRFLLTKRGEIGISRTGGLMGCGAVRPAPRGRPSERGAAPPTPRKRLAGCGVGPLTPHGRLGRCGARGPAPHGRPAGCGAALLTPHGWPAECGAGRPTPHAAARRMRSGAVGSARTARRVRSSPAHSALAAGRARSEPARTARSACRTRGRPRCLASPSSLGLVRQSQPATHTAPS